MDRSTMPNGGALRVAAVDADREEERASRDAAGSCPAPRRRSTAHGRPLRAVARLSGLAAALLLAACAAPGGVTGEGSPRGGAAPAPESLPADARTADRVAGPDADRDAIADAADDCPGSAPGEIVDARGCALFTRTLEGVTFASGTQRLDDGSRLALDRLAADLQAHPDVTVRLEGHTDNRGTASSNLELSKERVMAVARYLVARGVSPARLVPYGYGESRPRMGNATAAGRERNRRIEIVLQDPADAPPPALAEPDAPRQNEPEPETSS